MAFIYLKCLLKITRFASDTGIVPQRGSPRDDRLARAFATKMLTFATGRELGFSDRPELDRIVRDTAQNKHRLRDLLHRIIQSKIFLNK